MKKEGGGGADGGVVPLNYWWDNTLMVFTVTDRITEDRSKRMLQLCLLQVTEGSRAGNWTPSEAE